ncbi:Unknown protein [Striga hermonthica]|uniref:DUF674 domain-containing protein n=1 Tax=Striga hermonthica TaxID=68872 RepID=A0A9N7MJP4_STRHE|nr:Unknown protein [Striga hermonthica]
MEGHCQMKISEDSNFTDVLLSFLTLPLGTIVRVLNKHYGYEAPVLGSLTTLYNGIRDLDNGLFLSEDCKNLLLNPIRSSEDEFRRLKINVDDTPPTRYFRCGGGGTMCFSIFPNVSMYFSGLKCNCGRPLDKKIYVRGVDDSSGGVFIASKASLIITDDLQILPSATNTVVQILRNSGITDATGIKERSVTLGFNEIMNLLKGSLVSRAPFTELILKKNSMKHVATNYRIGVPPVDLNKKLMEPFSDKKMTMKAIVLANKLLFAEVDGDFVDFLFSLLALPLGRVEWLLGCDTRLSNADKLYRSVANGRNDKYLKNKYVTKAQLLKPKVPLCYYSRTHSLSPTEVYFPDLYYFYDNGGCLSPLPSLHLFSGRYVSSYKFPEGQVTKRNGQWVSNSTFAEGKAKYVNGTTMYMVTDDLTVTPLSSTSGLSVLNSLKIPLSEVKELELVVGLKEALSILKASLTSSRALTDGLITPFLMMKKPKQEG